MSYIYDISSLRVNDTPWPLYLRELPGNQSIKGLLGLRAGLDGFGKSRRNRDSIRGPSSP